MQTCPICTNNLRCELCRSRTSGAKFREGSAFFMPNSDTFASIDFECPQGKEWHDRVVTPEKPRKVMGDLTVLPLIGVKLSVVPSPEQIKEQGELAKQRFEICKSCKQATENGHKCALHKGCCFGAWRSRPGSKCYATPPKWGAEEDTPALPDQTPDASRNRNGEEDDGRPAIAGQTTDTRPETK